MYVYIYTVSNTCVKMAEKESGNPAQDEKSDDNTGSDRGNCTFKSLGVVDVLCEACEGLKWKEPTKIQRESIPVALAGNDVIGLAETGSGKTGAFALPILQALLENPQRLFALVLTPTRELAFQISEQFEALGATIGKFLPVISMFVWGTCTPRDWHLGGTSENWRVHLLEVRNWCSYFDCISPYPRKFVMPIILDILTRRVFSCLNSTCIC